MTVSSDPELYYVPYETFLSDLEAIAQQLDADTWKPDFLVGVGRGGLVPAAYLSHRTAITMLSVERMALVSNPFGTCIIQAEIVGMVQPPSSGLA